MLQTFYDEDLLTRPLDQVLTFARTLEGAGDRVMATRENSNASFHCIWVETVSKEGETNRKREVGITFIICCWLSISINYN